MGISKRMLMEKMEKEMEENIHPIHGSNIHCEDCGKKMNELTIASLQPICFECRMDKDD